MSDQAKRWSQAAGAAAVVPASYYGGNRLRRLALLHRTRLKKRVTGKTGLLMKNGRVLYSDGMSAHLNDLVGKAKPASAMRVVNSWGMANKPLRQWKNLAKFAERMKTLGILGGAGAATFLGARAAFGPKR